MNELGNPRKKARGEERWRNPTQKTRRPRGRLGSAIRRVAARVPQRHLGHRRCEQPAASGSAAVAEQAELGGISGIAREAAGTADQPRAWLDLGWA